jgi:exportin-1
MKESFPGVMNMAVNTFLKISVLCKNEFIYGNGKQEDSSQFFKDIIRNLQDHISLLEEKDKLGFYEAVGNIISADRNN